MTTIIDTAARPPTPDAIKAAGHVGQIVYISPDRTSDRGFRYDKGGPHGHHAR